MKKIDWYIIKNFLSTFFFSIILFALIAVVIDISEKTEDFVKSQLTPFQIFTQYYIGFIPHIIALLFPLFVFIAVIFSASKLAGRSEIIAILASGVSFNRLLYPFCIGGTLLGSVLFYANNYIIPVANQIRGNFETVYIDKNSNYNALLAKNNNLYIQIDKKTYGCIDNYDTLLKRGSPFFLNEIKGEEVVENIRSEVIYWDHQKNAWKLTNVLQRDVKNNGEHLKTLPEKLIKFNFTPLDLSRDKYTKDKLTSPVLKNFIEFQKQKGSEGINELVVELYRRDAAFVTVLILTLMGSIIASKKVRGGSGGHLAVGFIMAGIFIIISQFSTVFATKGNLLPIVAVWLPNFVFSFVTLFYYLKAIK